MNAKVHIAGLAAAVVTLSAAGAFAVGPLDGIRVYDINSNVFDYVFTSYFRDSSGWVLSVNDLDGATKFKRVGEKIGDYAIVSFEPKEGTVFSEQVSAPVKTKGGALTLRSSRGETAVLELGKALPRDGWLARLVSLETGQRWAVRAGGSLSAGGVNVAIESVSGDAVFARVGGGVEEVRVLSREERDQMAAARDQRLAQRKAAAAEAEVEREILVERVRAEGRQGDRTTLAPGPISVEVRRVPDMYSRYPVYMVLPDGRVLNLTQGMPTFPGYVETRMTGPGYSAVLGSELPSEVPPHRVYRPGTGMIPFPRTSPMPPERRFK